jgi:hypothetical protein
MRSSVALRLAAVSFAAFAVACSSDSPTAPSTNKTPATLSQVFGEMNLPGLGGANATLSPVPVAAVAAPVPSACSYNSSTQSFTCPAVSSGGMTFTQSFTLLDAAGKPQSQFDPNTTAAVRMTMTGGGTMVLTGNTSGSLTIDQQQDMTVSGLLTGTHVLNGTMTMHNSGTLTSGAFTTPINSTVTMTTANVVMPTGSAGSSAWPTSGTITEHMADSAAAAFASVMDMTMTFNGTSKVAVVIVFGTTTQHCTLDMASSGMVCA